MNIQGITCRKLPNNLVKLEIYRLDIDLKDAPPFPATLRVFIIGIINNTEYEDVMKRLPSTLSHLVIERIFQQKKKLNATLLPLQLQSLSLGNIITVDEYRNLPSGLISASLP